MKNSFIKIDCIGGYHVIRVATIMSISPKKGNENKSSITCILGNEKFDFYSTETETNIFKKIEENEQQTK